MQAVEREALELQKVKTLPAEADALRRTEMDLEGWAACEGQGT